jgi:hypothetical protein
MFLCCRIVPALFLAIFFRDSFAQRFYHKSAVICQKTFRETEQTEAALRFKAPGGRSPGRDRGARMSLSAWRIDRNPLFGIGEHEVRRPGVRA